MSHLQRACMKTSRPLTSSETGVLAVVLANVIETRQSESAAPLSVVCLADFREWFPSLSMNRVRQLIAAIGDINWHVDADSLRQPMPIFRHVLDKGTTFVVEVDYHFIAQRVAEKSEPVHLLPELVGLTEADAREALIVRGLSVRIETRDGQSTSPFRSADIRRDRANLKIEQGIVVLARIG